MASAIFLRLILLAALAATTNLRLVSSAETSPPPQSVSPPMTAPPPPTLSFTQENQINNIIDALIGAGDFAGWANILSSADPSSLPLTATFFIPSNEAISHLPTSTSVGINFDPFLIPYHIVPQRLIFSDLQRLSTGTRLPTLLPSKYIVITDNSTSNFTIDDSQVTHPDIFVSAGFSVHGIQKVLEYSVYDPFSPPPVNTDSPSAKSSPSPAERKPLFPGEFAVDISSSVSCFCSKSLMIFSVGWTFLAFKIF